MRPYRGERRTEAVLLEGLVRCAEAVPIHVAAIRTDLVRKIAGQPLLPSPLRIDIEL